MLSADVVQGDGLAGPVPDLAPDGQCLGEVAQGLVQVAPGPVQAADVVQGGGLAGPVSESNRVQWRVFAAGSADVGVVFVA